MANEHEEPTSDDLRLAPPEGKSLAELRQDILNDDIKAEDDEEFGEDAEHEVRPFQFRLGDLMLITTVAAVGFAMMNILPLDIYAGTMGALAIVGLAALSLLQPEHAMPHLLWWTLLATYIITSIVAVITKG